MSKWLSLNNVYEGYYSFEKNEIRVRVKGGFPSFKISELSFKTIYPNVSIQDLKDFSPRERDNSMTSIEVEKGSTVSIRYDDEGRVWVDGIEPIVQEPTEIASVVRFRADGSEFCAFKANNDSGPNYRVTTTRNVDIFEGRESCITYSNMFALVGWSDIVAVAEKETIRVYQPTVRPTGIASGFLTSIYPNRVRYE